MRQQDIIDLVNRNNVEAVRAALQNGADANTQDENDRSLLLLATINGQLSLAKLLIEHGADVNLQDAIYDSPFLFAGASGQTEFIKLFLANGARFDVFNRYNGTALIPACERGHVEAVRLLANTKSFPIDHINRLGWTALLEAVVLGDGSKEYQEIVRILKDAGAELSITDVDGTTALEHARANKFGEIVKILES